MIQALVFDFDGLILDTETAWYRSFSELYEEHGTSLPLDVWGQCVGAGEEIFDPYAELESRIGRAIDREELTERVRQKMTAYLGAHALRPGVRKYLQTAARLGLKIGLASSSRRTWVEGHLRQYGLLDYFQCLLTADQVSKTKPDPELYEKALQCLGVKAEDAVAFEDSPNGVTAAKRAGMFCVLVPNPVTAQLAFRTAYDLKIGSMAEMDLETLLDRLNSPTPVLPSASRQKAAQPGEGK